MEYTGFVYLWYDRKHKLFCIGSRFGKIDDGYITSTGHMINAYKKRPEDFKRKILEYCYGDRNALFEIEQKWLDKIKDEELYYSSNRRYYNRKKNASGVDSVTASKLRNEFWNTERGEQWKKELSEKMKGNSHNKGKIPWNKGKKCKSISIGKKLNPIIYTEEMKAKKSEQVKQMWKNGIYDNRPKPSKEHIEKIRKSNIGRTQTDYQKQRARESNLGKIVSADTALKIAKARLNDPILICPQCGKKR